MNELTERELAVMKCISAGLNGMNPADRIAANLGYRPARSGRLAVSATLRSLQKRNLVGRIPPQDQWDRAYYFLMPDGKEACSKAHPNQIPNINERGRE